MPGRQTQATETLENYLELPPTPRCEPLGAAHESFLSLGYEKRPVLKLLVGTCSLGRQSKDKVGVGNLQNNCDISHFTPMGFRLVAQVLAVEFFSGSANITSP